MATASVETGLDASFAPADGPPPLAPMARPVRWLGHVVDWTVIAMGTTLIALVFVNVVIHAFGKDMAWLTELGELLMVWVTFLGGAAAAQRGAHMAINEFLDKLDAAGRRWADAAVQGLCLVVLAVVVFYGVRIVAGGWDNTLTTLEWPMSWQYLPLPLGCALMMVFVGWDLLLILRGVPRQQRYLQD
jgi:TRAP-type C4-dicarboxylate transport system permease small subunit